MALSWKARRRWSLVLLLVWLPLFIVIAVTVMNALPRQPILIEVAIYAALGIVWALPFRKVFRGIGKPDPDAERKE